MDCGISRGLVHARSARALVRINPKHHAAQVQRNVGLAHLVDKALRVLGTGELLLKVRKAKTGVDTLAEDSAQMLLALHDGHVGAGLMRGKRGCHTGGGPPPITTTSNACVCTASTASLSIALDLTAAILAHPLQRSLNEPRASVLQQHLAGVTPQLAG